MFDHWAPCFYVLGGRVQAVLTSDSPALVGSTITFAVNLVFPRCQKEDASGNIVYEKNCRNGKECYSHHRDRILFSKNSLIALFWSDQFLFTEKTWLAQMIKCIYFGFALLLVKAEKLFVLVKEHEWLQTQGELQGELSCFRTQQP